MYPLERYQRAAIRQTYRARRWRGHDRTAAIAGAELEARNIVLRVRRAGAR